MHWIVRQFIKFHEKHPWIYTGVSYGLGVFFIYCLIIAFQLFTPAKLLRQASWSTPPELLDFSQYQIYFFSLGLFTTLVIALLMALVGPLYLFHKKAVDTFILQQRRRWLIPLEGTGVIKKGILLLLALWVLIWSIVTLQILSGAYPPSLMEIMRQTYGISGSDHYADFINSLFFRLVILGSAITFFPVVLYGYFRFTTKKKACSLPPQ
ncbi:hypothetical protein [Kiloniella laminariae]|uniref:hypothetical protein n=1 Tax=Kiloniella laminariae TaxID=454162 RepID=UPI000365BB09|nr:hypothetical protein [Kiloniella laminariae]